MGPDSISWELKRRTRFRVGTIIKDTVVCLALDIVALNDHLTGFSFGFIPIHPSLLNTVVSTC